IRLFFRLPVMYRIIRLQVQVVGLFKCIYYPEMRAAGYFVHALFQAIISAVNIQVIIPLGQALENRSGIARINRVSGVKTIQRRHRFFSVVYIYYTIAKVYLVVLWGYPKGSFATDAAGGQHLGLQG